jgi:hypothetical protein
VSSGEVETVVVTLVTEIYIAAAVKKSGFFVIVLMKEEGMGVREEEKI